MDDRTPGTYEFYISPQGNDNWTGRFAEPAADGTDGPLASLEGALKKLRLMKLRGEATAPVTFWLRGGSYPISRPIVLKPEDSHPAAFRAYPGETPVMDGGRRLSGWTEEQVNGISMWTLDIPSVRDGHWYFRQLFVNGKRRNRTRLPKQGFYQIKDVPGLDLSQGSWSQLGNGSDRFVFEKGHMKHWKNLADVEVIVHHFWVDERMLMESVEEEKSLFISKTRSVFVLMDDVNPIHAKYYVENTLEGLSEPGEWYLDRAAGKLHYIPMDGETPENTEIVAPCVHQFLRLEGSPDSHRYIENVRFEGITFQYSDWYHTMPSSSKRPQYFNTSGFEDIEKACATAPQAAIHVPGSIYLEGAKGCAVNKCRILHAGFYGIELFSGCQGNRIAGNEISDTGAGGIRLNGSNHPGQHHLHTCNNDISSNHIHHGGNVFLCGIGVLIAHGYCNRVCSNHIHDLYYSGISCGWVWGYGESVSRENVLEKNHIHDLGKGLMSDMGGIYLLGMQPGTVVRGNLIHDVEKCNYGGWGVYLDEGSSFVTVENNVVIGTSSQAFHQHYGRENMIRNNIFAFSREGQLQVSRHDRKEVSFPIEKDLPNSINFIKNIILTKGGNAHNFGGELRPCDRAYFSEMNLYWDAVLGEKGKERFAEGKDESGKLRTYSFSEWQTMGYDVLSLYANPGVTITDDFKVLFTEYGLACNMGFKRNDLTSVV
jgi:parallel beta-helix repeat protein